jgi:hypothetical protein
MSRRLSKEESRQRYAEGRNLWNEFDPIGVFQIDSEWPKDEYERYVGPTLRLCEEGKDLDAFREYLESVVYEHMGLNRTPLGQRAMEKFVEKFRDWYKASWPDTIV